MKLVSLRISNYRTVGAAQVLPLDGRTTIVGPNNSGKTNVLRAVEMLFTGADNRLGYSKELDLTFGAGTAKTSLLATFDGDPTIHPDDAMYQKLDELHGLLGTDRGESTVFTLNLQFSSSSNASYQFFPNATKPSQGALKTQYSRVQTQLVRDLLGSFAVHYVPSAKSISDLYEDLLMPFMRGLAARALEDHLPELQAELDTVAEEVNAELARVGLASLKTSFTLPQRSAQALFSHFDLNVADPTETVLASKGQGIQSTSLLASLLWITREEEREGLQSIWLLEEPESYLHPELSRSCVSLLEELAKESQVVVTTHSLAFVPQDPVSVVGCELADGRTTLQRFATYTEATERIRASLGVRFSDFYNLGVANLLLEGKSDREMIAWARDLLDDPESLRWPTLASAELLDFGGVRHLAGFLRATYPLIRPERAVVAVFDGDEAGTRERQGLQQFFGQVQVPFESGRDFVSVRSQFAIESLFPDEWIVALHDDHPSWFETFSQDSLGNLEPFRVRDGRKAAMQNALMEQAEGADPGGDWSTMWEQFLDACEAALDVQLARLANSSSSIVVN